MRAVLFFLLATAFLCLGFFRGKVLIDLGGDELKCYLSSALYVHRWAGEGIFPLWNTLSLCGHPFGIHSISSYHFLNLLAWFFEPGTAYSWLVLVSVFLNGYFFYLFLRRHDVGVFAALVPAWIWMLGRRETEIGFFFLPLLFWLADRYAQHFEKKWRFALFTAALALYFLNGNPQSAFYNVLFLLAYLVWRAGIRFEIFLPFILAAGLTAFYYVRAAELMALSNNDARNAIGMFLPTHYLLLLFPRLFEAPGRPELNFIVPRALEVVFSSAKGLGSVQVFTSPLYLGVACVIAFFAASKSKTVMKFFFWAVVVSFLGLTFYPVFYLFFIRFIPVLRGLVGVGRIFLIGEFSLLVVLGLAIDQWLAASDESRKRIVRTARIFAAAGFIFLALALSSKALLLASHDRLSALIDSNFGHERAREFFEFFGGVLSWKNPHVIWPVLIVAGFLAMIEAYHRRWINRKVFQAVFFAWTVLDLGLVWGLARPAWAREAILQGSEVADVLKKDKGLFRTLMVEDSQTFFSRMFLVPEANMSYDIATPDGYEYLYLKRYVRFYEWLTERPEGMGPYLHPLDHFNKDAADFLNIKYFLTSGFNSSLDGKPAYRKTWEGKGYKIYENLGAMPRAFVVHRAVFLPDEQKAKEYIGKNLARLKEEVVLEKTADYTPAQTSEPEMAEITRYTPGEIDLNAELKENGFLVMSDNYYPGWRVSIDGRPAELLKADYTFRAVYLLKGKHAIRLTYDPVSLKKGVNISLATMGLAIALLWIPWRVDGKN